MVEIFLRPKVSLKKQKYAWHTEFFTLRVNQAEIAAADFAAQTFCDKIMLS